jgi:hypothetical protein
MRVTCKLCQFEKEGACTKKRQGGKPKKIKLSKRRTCNIYEEDAMKVFSQFRKREAHRALRQQDLRRAQTDAVMKQLREQKAAAAKRISEATDGSE